MSDFPPIVLTGDRPTGPLHLGHYFGSLVNRRQLAREHPTYLMIADVQALTDNWDDPEKVARNVREVLLDNLALGLPETTTIYVQSALPAIAELTVFFSNLVTLARLQRNPTVKAEIGQKQDKFGVGGESLTYGFLGYPVSQAADILSLRATLVPVGADQLPMLEQTREISTKFNRIYGEVFPSPEAILSEGSRIMGLDGNAKMSKSLGNAIYLKDTPEDTLKKIKKAKTDSIAGITYDPEERPEISNLLRLYALTQEKSIPDVAGEVESMRTGDFKLHLAESLNAYLSEFRERRVKLEQNEDYLKEVLRTGTEKANAEAQETIAQVKSVMGINYL